MLIKSFWLQELNSSKRFFSAFISFSNGYFDDYDGDIWMMWQMGGEL
jgi:hypothetical protein